MADDVRSPRRIDGLRDFRLEGMGFRLKAEATKAEATGRAERKPHTSDALRL
jgi:hypothetical protein